MSENNVQEQTAVDVNVDPSAAPAVAAPTSADPVDANPYADTKFLIVDDFSTMRRVMVSLLKDMGFERAEAAADGGVALEMLKKTKFDFIITDILMPNMTGFELLTAIKADASLRHIPVLMVTAEARKEDILRSVQCGAAGYIVKPFTKTTLEERVKKILEKQTAVT